MKRASQEDVKQMSIFDRCDACNGTGDLCERKKSIQIECIFCDGRGYGKKTFKPARRNVPSQKQIMEDGLKYYQSEIEADALYNPYNEQIHTRNEY